MFSKRSSKLNLLIFLQMAIVIALCLISAFALTAFTLSAAAAEGGTCGDNAYYRIDNGKLTVYGSGNIYHYSEENPAPWKEFSESITSIEVEYGITTIGSKAFAGLNRAYSATIADSVVNVSSFAFFGCTALKSVKLSANTKYLYEGAFEECTSLYSIRLPDSLYRISDYVFYRCYKLACITVPASVKYFGNFVFGYCYDLAFANVLVEGMEQLPVGTFNGCSSLTTVSLTENVETTGERAFEGCNNLLTVYCATENTSSLSENISCDVERFTEDNVIPESVQIRKAYTVKIHQEDGGSTMLSFIKVEETDNAVITSTTELVVVLNENNEVVDVKSSSFKVDAKVENEEGWDEVCTAIENIKEESSVTAQDAERSEVNVIVEDDSANIPGATLSELAGEDADLNIESANGSTVSIDCNRIKEETVDTDKKYSLGYTVTANSSPSKKQKATIGDSKSYILVFEESVQLDQSPAVYVGTEWAKNLATLYYENDNGLSKMQTVVIDNAGYAHFYISNTTNVSNYIVAINVKGEKMANAIVPPSLHNDFGITDSFDDILYAPTVMRLYKGLNVVQVILIVLSAVVGVSIIVGLVIFIFYRKKKLNLMYAIKHGDRKLINATLNDDE